MGGRGLRSSGRYEFEPTKASIRAPVVWPLHNEHVAMNQLNAYGTRN